MPDKVVHGPIESVVDSLIEHPFKVVLAGMFCGCLIEVCAYLTEGAFLAVRAFNEKKND